MISLRNISKSYRTRKGWNKVLDGISMDFDTGVNVGILGRNGSGKTTLLRLIGGVEPPDKGEIIKNVRTSWPIGYRGGFQPNLTGRENTQFISRIYGADSREIEEYVQDFSELGVYYDMPMKTYSAGMRGRVAFAVSLAMHFECYLVDEAIAVGDRRFKQKYVDEFRGINDKASIIIVSHQTKTIKQFSDSVAILHKGKLTYFEDMQEGLDVYEKVGKNTSRL